MFALASYLMISFMISFVVADVVRYTLTVKEGLSMSVRNDAKNQYDPVTYESFKFKLKDKQLPPY